MFERQQPDPRETEGESQTDENEGMDVAHRQPVIDDAHREAPGEPVQPEAGHPVPGETTAEHEPDDVATARGDLERELDIPFRVVLRRDFLELFLRHLPDLAVGPAE